MSKVFGDVRHVLSANQFSKEWLERTLFVDAHLMRHYLENRPKKLLELVENKRLRFLFYEPSERTLDSFISAADLLGMKSVWLGDPSCSSSQAKGESFEDMIRIVNQYQYDAIILRSKSLGEAALAAKVSGIPIINAGDGAGEHPTQALLDVFTIHNSFGTLDGLTIGLVGDLKYSRTIHSLIRLLARWNLKKIYLISPPVLKLGETEKEILKFQQIEVEETTSLSAVASELDVVYLTRLQVERMPSSFVIEPKDLDVKLTRSILDNMKEASKVLHPLPRNNIMSELPEELTNDPKVIIFDQARNGLFVRMALLHQVLRS